jgi:hypothetical protein
MLRVLLHSAPFARTPYVRLEVQGYTCIISVHVHALGCVVGLGVRT